MLSRLVRLYKLADMYDGSITLAILTNKYSMDIAVISDTSTDVDYTYRGKKYYEYVTRYIKDSDKAKLYYSEIVTGDIKDRVNELGVDFNQIDKVVFFDSGEFGFIGYYLQEYFSSVEIYTLKEEKDA